MLSKIKLTTALLLFCLQLSNAQKYELVFSEQIDVNAREFFFGEGQKQFYLTNSGKHLIVNNEKRYFNYNLESGKMVKEAEHSKKMNSALNLIQNNTGVPYFNVDEGTAFYLSEKDDLIIFFDWSADRNEIKTERLSTGEVLWQTDEYQYTSSFSQQLFASALGMGESVASEAEFTRPQLEDDQLRSFGENQYLSSSATKVARSLMHYLEKENLIILADNRGLIGIDVTTGETKWIHEVEKLKMGWIRYLEDSGDIIFVNHKNRFKEGQQDGLAALTKKNRTAGRIILRLNASTGNLVWENEYLGDFLFNRSFIDDGKIFLDYSVVEVYDLADGSRLCNTVPEEVADADDFNGKNNMQLSYQTMDPAMVDGQFVYSTDFIIKAVNFGFPAAIVKKFNNETGELVWESNPTEKSCKMYYQNQQYVILERSKGLAKTSLVLYNKDTGSKEKETDFIKNYWFRNGAGTIFTEEAIFRTGKNTTYVYDPSDFSLTNEFDTEKSDIGKLQALFPVRNKLGYIGDKGISFTDKTGEVLNQIEAKKVQAAFWNSNVSVVFDKKKILIVNNYEEIVKQQFEFRFDEDMLYFLSEDASTLAIIDPAAKTVLVYKDQESST